MSIFYGSPERLGLWLPYQYRVRSYCERQPACQAWLLCLTNGKIIKSYSLNVSNYIYVSSCEHTYEYTKYM